MTSGQPCRRRAAPRLPAILLLALLACARVGAQEPTQDTLDDSMAELDSLILDAVKDLEQDCEYLPYFQPQCII
jgi:hypothetical protein